MLRSKLAVWLYRHGMHRLAYIASPSVAHGLYMREILAEMQNAVRCAWNRSDPISTEPQERVEQKTETEELSKKEEGGDRGMLTPEQLKIIADEAERIGDAMRSFVEAARNVGGQLKDLKDAIQEFSTAFRWAETAHPEWVRIYRRTKKRRTRKKYQDRIMRTWRKEGGNEL